MTACQQVAAPCVGMLALIADSIPLAATAYDEMADALCPPMGPVSETKAAPFGANETERSGANARVNNDGCERAVDLDMKGVDAIGELLGHEKELSVRTKREGSRSRIARAEECDGIGNRLELSILIQVVE